MPVNYDLIWNQVAPGWINFVQREPLAIQLRENVLRPAFESLLGPVEGKKILDAGCGEGDFSRWLARKGARVTGIDISQVMLDAARSEEERLKQGIEYIQRSVLDLGDLAGFDAVLSNQVISVVPDYELAFQSIQKALKPGGSAMVSITHPFFDGVGPGWVTHGPNDQRWWANRYMARVDGNAAHGAPTYHRSFTDYINAALAAGFVVTGMNEPVAAEEYSRSQPPSTWAWDHIPTLAILRLRKEDGGRKEPLRK